MMVRLVFCQRPQTTLTTTEYAAEDITAAHLDNRHGVGSVYGVCHVTHVAATIDVAINASVLYHVNVGCAEHLTHINIVSEVTTGI